MTVKVTLRTTLMRIQKRHPGPELPPPPNMMIPDSPESSRASISPGASDLPWFFIRPFAVVIPQAALPTPMRSETWYSPASHGRE